MRIETIPLEYSGAKIASIDTASGQNERDFAHGIQVNCDLKVQFRKMTDIYANLSE